MKLVTQKKFVPRKSLSQNFLRSAIALRKIIEAGEIKKNDVILEIGPGKGKLTEKLLEKARIVIAVEKDRELFEFLKNKFTKQIKSCSLALVHDDILSFEILKFLSGPFGIGHPADSNPGSLSRPDHTKNLEPLRYKTIANIPYNITGAILKKFLTAKRQPESMVLMVQHEVAQRIMGRRGPASAQATAGKKESILSISVKAYGVPKMIMKVAARYFSPKPKVDSAIIAIKNISHKIFEENQIDENKFWEIVKIGFAHKRKKLSSNLKDICQRDTLTSLGNKRAEDLTLSDWILLAKQGIIKP